MPQKPETEALRLAPFQLKAAVDAAGLSFATTAELEPFQGFFGQDRAHAALRFGVAMGRPGYNVYVMGETGSGRLSLSREFLLAAAREQPAPSDWVYANHFAEPREPLALRLPAGRGKALCQEVEKLVDDLLALFPTAFDGPAFQQRKNAIDREFNRRYNEALAGVEHRAQSLSVAMFREGDAVTFTPLAAGKPLDEAGFAHLAEAEREAFHQHVQELEDVLAQALVELPRWKRYSLDQLRQLHQETVAQAIEPLLGELEGGYAQQPDVLNFFQTLREDLFRTLAELLAGERNYELREEYARRAALLERYLPKLIVSHTAGDGAPVVYEPHPAYANLFGRVEYINEQGALVTHHRLIAAGALHLANGGYLVLEAEKLLAEPFAWPALKRALQTREIRIETPLPVEQGGALMTLAPQVIPLAVKLVLVGSREIYYLMQEMDEEFGELFRVLADFDDQLPRDTATLLDFARLVHTSACADGCRPLTAAAVALLAEYSSRRAEHQQHLSARLRDVLELVAEADLARGQQGEPDITDRHIVQALSAKEQRTGRISRLVLEDMLEGIVLVATAGEAVGQANGLTVLEIGDTRFGVPARITATAYPGTRGVVDIEREVELGQPIHSKGVLILSGYLGNRYARHFSLAISANLAMEQSYGYIDGDSAALAEVCALISALTGIPLKQSFAVTGSINQHGEVQAVGGVNEKIEGFFSLCQARGLDGNQGVIIPRANVRNLMLKEEVIAATEQGRFTLYAVADVDEALGLLTGQVAGKADAEGRYPEGSVNAATVARLEEISRLSAEVDRENEN